MKTVKYDGKYYDVPEWVNYIFRMEGSNYLIGTENKPTQVWNTFWDRKEWSINGQKVVIDQISLTYGLVEV